MGNITWCVCVRALNKIYALHRLGTNNALELSLQATNHLSGKNGCFDTINENIMDTNKLLDNVV
jgi:hypothetical protein